MTNFLRLALLFGFAYCGVLAYLHGFRAVAGSNDFVVVAGGVVKPSHVNQYKTALGVDVVPRTSTGAVTDEAGSLGSSTYEWLRAYVSSGHFVAGDIKMHHTYNGTVTCGQGWMLCDGRTITEANYDAEHSAGDWDTYVGSSPLDGLYLPDFVDAGGTQIYVRGVDATTQDGSVAITTTGNNDHEIDIQHNHTVDSHRHQWYDDVSSANDDSYNSSGVATDITVDNSENFTGISAHSAAGVTKLSGDWYTSNSSPGTDNQLSLTQNIAPESHVVQFCMRVIN